MLAGDQVPKIADGAEVVSRNKISITRVKKVVKVKDKP